MVFNTWSSQTFKVSPNKAEVKKDAEDTVGGVKCVRTSVRVLGLGPEWDSNLCLLVCFLKNVCPVCTYVHITCTYLRCTHTHT